jgi:putative ABC transport system ATP-binding protein
LDHNHSIVEARALSKRVASPEGTLTILDDVSLQIQPGEAVAIVGVSGSGKSTLLSLLAGLDRATSGEIYLDGTELGALDEDGRAGLRARLLSFVFQSFHLLDNLTALENVMLPLELRSQRGVRRQASDALAAVGLAARTGHYPNQLSGGEQQRVAIARAFSTRPKVLLADEPTGSLDARTGARIIELLLQLKGEAGTTLIMVTHDPAVADNCDRQLQLDAGRLLR